MLLSNPIVELVSHSYHCHYHYHIFVAVSHKQLLYYSQCAHFHKLSIHEWLAPFDQFPSYMKQSSNGFSAEVIVAVGNVDVAE